MYQQGQGPDAAPGAEQAASDNGPQSDTSDDDVVEGEFTEAQ
jgi:hypothetical protein